LNIKTACSVPRKLSTRFRPFRQKTGRFLTKESEKFKRKTKQNKKYAAISGYLTMVQPDYTVTDVPHLIAHYISKELQRDF
jgi:hypothetical protein